MVIWIDMVCLALALAPSCAALHFWCLYIMLSKSNLPRRCDWKDGFSYPSPVVKLFWDFMFKRTPGYFMSTSCHFADLEYCTTKDAKGKAIAFQITTRNTVCCSSIGLQVFSCSTRFSVQQNVARLVLLSTAYRWVMTRCDRNSAQGRVCGFFRTCTAAKPTNLIGKWRSLCLFRMFEPNFGHTHTQKQTNCP